MGRPRYDWVSIRQEYISTDISTKEIAEKYGIRRRTVEDKCAKEGWVRQRKEYVADVTDRVAEKVTERNAEAQAESLATIDRCGNLLLAHIEDFLLHDKVSPSAMEHISNVLKTLEELSRRFNRQLTKTQEHKMYVELERLKMDQQKAEAFNPDSKIVVQIEGFEEEWSE